MTWDEFLETARAVGNVAVQKIGEVADSAKTQLRITAAEAKLKNAYAEFGKAAYRHFTADADDPAATEELANQVKKIATLEAALQKLREE